MTAEHTEQVITSVRISAYIDGVTVWFTDVPVGHNYVMFDPTIGPRMTTQELKFTAAPIIQPTIVKFYDCDRPHCEYDE